MERLPNFFIAGAPKSGTSSLFTWLADHPNAVGSKEKETYFFVDPGTHMYRPDAHIDLGLEVYKNYFEPNASRSAKIILECTPAYLYYQTALNIIPDLQSSPKCLFVLRNPAEQIYSLFQYFRNNWNWIPDSMTFKEYLDKLQSGQASFKGNELAENALEYARYFEFLVKWKERLGMERMKVVTFDNLVNSPASTTKHIAEWIGLNSNFYDSYDYPRENETYEARVKRLQKLNVALRSRLPKGKLYKSVRSVYRKVNTHTPKAISEQDKELIVELSKKFHADNIKLGEEFDLNLQSWMNVGIVYEHS